MKITIYALATYCVVAFVLNVFGAEDKTPATQPEDAKQIMQGKDPVAIESLKTNIIKQREHLIRDLVSVLLVEPKDKKLALSLDAGQSAAAYLLGELRADDPVAIEALIKLIDVLASDNFEISIQSVAPCYGALVKIGKPASVACLNHLATEQMKNDRGDFFARGSLIVEVIRQVEGGDVIRCGADGILQSNKTPDDNVRPMVNLFSKDITGQHPEKNGPLVRYDAHYNDNPKARDLEAANDQNANYNWAGYCRGATRASIFLHEPAPEEDSGFEMDDLKGYWSLLGNDANVIRNPNLSFADCYRDVERPDHTHIQLHFVPVAGHGNDDNPDNSDGWADDVHHALELGLRTKVPAHDPVRPWDGKILPLYSELGAAYVDDSTDTLMSISNHAIWKYESTWKEAPGGDPNLVEITMTIYANSDYEPPTNQTKDRRLVYVYRVRYNGNGTLHRVNGGGPEQPKNQDFISVAGFNAAGQPVAPLYAPFDISVYEDITSWDTPVRQVSEANVRALDTANPPPNP